MQSQSLNDAQSDAHVYHVAKTVTLSRVCLCGCGASLEGRRSHTKTATPSCRKRFERERKLSRTISKQIRRSHKTLGIVCNPEMVSGVGADINYPVPDLHVVPLPKSADIRAPHPTNATKLLSHAMPRVSPPNSRWCFTDEEIADIAEQWVQELTAK